VSVFFLQYWRTFINKAHLEVLMKWYSYIQSFISLQSYNIFTSLAESLVLLIIAYRDYYSDYLLLPWEHSTEALKHVFGIAKQLVLDFTTYEFFKVLQRVIYRDKIIRNGKFKIDKNKLLASGK
jgi:hypothetical protein